MRIETSSLTVVAVIVLIACSNERTMQPSVEQGADATASAAAAGALPAPPTTQADTPSVPAPMFEGLASGPSSGGRDPFEPTSAATLQPPPKTRDVLPRKSKRFALDELKLVGIVSGSSDAPRAMLIDPRGKGWVVTRGELIGRPETLRDRNGDHAVSWRVDRIRESDVVLVREDVAHSTLVPSATRVLALRHDERPIADDAELDD